MRSMRRSARRKSAVRAEARTTATWERLCEWVAARTGLHFPAERRTDLERALESAAQELGHASGADIARRLMSAPVSADELRTLVSHLTIGETYFFRERPSFDALATQVLPVLIHRKRAGDRRLRLWSAACSTGEEAYSLAILLQRLLPDWRDWTLSILGTDINPRFLRKAEEGVYGEWSFREAPAEFRALHFLPAGKGRHRIRPEVREIVKFAELNLAADHFPSVATDTNAMDLILCRNLLIYFTPAHARRLIASLRHALVDDGWLMVSPSECSQALFTGFSAVNFPGTVLYRKRNEHECAEARLSESGSFVRPAPPVARHALAAQRPSEPSPPQAFPSAPLLPEKGVARMLDATAAAPEDGGSPAQTLRVARGLYAQGRYADATTVLRAALAASRLGDPRLLALLAHALANHGDLDKARVASERWIAADKLDPAAHYLNAMVLQELGQRAAARAALLRAIYLRPEFTLAHFALGNCARAEARHDEARRHFANAAHLLRGRPDEEEVAESEGLSAGRLREIIAALTSGGEA
jgi:chemotaxis protein methyltransferase CheR